MPWALSFFTVNSLLGVFLVPSEAVYMLPWYYTPDALQRSTNTCQGKEKSNQRLSSERWISLYAFACADPCVWDALLLSRTGPKAEGRVLDEDPENVDSVLSLLSVT